MERALSEAAHAEFWTSLDDAHREQASRICTEHEDGDFDESFLGFMDAYWMLSQWIPRDRMIYDVGCANGFQAWFFRYHRGYVGISDSPPVSRRFYAPNTTHFHGEMAEFKDKIDPVHFAIHHYVPSGRKDVVSRFQDLFTYYPRIH